MLISQKSKEIIDSCRFCWMCRHICPIGNATGQERNTARARALSLSLVERGAEPLSEVADNMYECALCGACTNECVTGWDPVRFTREIRLELALNGETPDYINRLIENICETGNVYGMKEYTAGLAAAIKPHTAKTDTLLFLGRDAIYKSPESAINAIRLMEAAGIEFTVLENEPDSGFAMNFLVGAAEETKQIMKSCADALDYDTIIAYDPADAKTFMRDFREWDIPLKGRTVTFTSYIEKLINDGALKPKKSDITVTVQDNYNLSRELEEFLPARNIISACADIKEMLLYNKDTVLAGNLIMNEYMPDVMKAVARNRAVNALNTGAEYIVTQSPAEYEMLKLGGEMPVMSIEEVVLKCLQA